METEQIFRTKTGFCHITNDKIILTRNGVVGSIANVAVGNNIRQVLITYGVISIGFMYFTYDYLIKQDYVMGFLFGLVAISLLYTMVASKNNSAKPIIDRKDIKDVTYNPGIAGLTRARFEVTFSENGVDKKRLILLPGTLAGGRSDVDNAIKIMKNANLLN